MLGVAAASDEPIAGGRHKVFGHHELAIIPQTSTIASHLPRAVGVAIAIDRARKLGVPSAWPGDAIVVMQLRRRLAEPRDRTGGDQHRRARRPPAPPRAAAPRLRGQRPRDQRPVAGRLGRSTRFGAGRRSGTRQPPGTIPRRRSALRASSRDWVRETRRPAVLHLAHRPLPRPRRRRRRDGLPDSGGHPGRSAARPLARNRRVARPNGQAHRGAARGGVPRRARTRAEAALDAARRPQLETAADVMRPLAPRSPGGRCRARRADCEPVEPPTEPRHARARDQPALWRRPPGASRGAPLRRGRGGQGRRLRRHPRAACAVRRRPRLRHAARRDVDPRPRARERGQRLPAAARDPVPRLSPQRGGPAPRRGGDAAVLLPGPLPQRHGRPDRRATATRRASAATSTTTTRSRCFATFRAS